MEKKRKKINILKELDNKMKFKSSIWNQDVTKAFNTTGSYSFDNLVYKSPEVADILINKYVK